MERRRDRHQRGDARPLGGEKQRDGAAHAGTENCGFAGSMILNQRKSRTQIIDLAAVRDVRETAARLADVRKIKTQGENSVFRQLLTKKDQLLAILIRLHAVAENHCAIGSWPGWMVQYAAQCIAAAVIKRNIFLAQHEHGRQYRTRLTPCLAENHNSDEHRWRGGIEQI